MPFDVNSIRSEFPILGEKVYGTDLVYLDNAATTQNPQSVIDVTVRMQTEINGNIHRGIHYMAEQCTELYEQARSTIQSFVGASSRKEIVFTSGATASLNLVAYSFSEQYIKNGDNILVTEMEHHSNIVPWQIQAQRRGALLRFIPINDDGSLNLDVLDSLIDERTRIVSVTETSNVLGTNNDVSRIASCCHAHGIPILVDGSQAVQHKRVDVLNPDVDFYVFSGHKIFSPTGIGVLYAKEKWLEEMPPFMSGGDMISTVSLTSGTTWAELPLKFEAGTSNYMGAIALNEAINWYSKFDIEQVNAHLAKLKDTFTEKLTGSIDGVTIYGTTKSKAPIVSFNIDGCFAMDVAQIADRQGVAMRSGTQCAEPLMTHYGIESLCRVSMAIYNTEEEINKAVSAISRAAKMLRR